MNRSTGRSPTGCSSSWSEVSNFGSGVTIVSSRFDSLNSLVKSGFPRNAASASFFCLNFMTYGWKTGVWMETGYQKMVFQKSFDSN